MQIILEQMFLFKMELSPNGSKDFLHGAVLIVRTIGLFIGGTVQDVADILKNGGYLRLSADAEFQQLNQFFFVITLFSWQVSSSPAETKNKGPDPS